MKKKFAVLGTAAAVLLSSSMAFAGAWNVPSNVRVVQISNTDTSGRIYSTIQSALSSITDASASKPYVIKVMPGVYNITAGIQMKSYVTLEGSGAENTIINYNTTETGDCRNGGTGAIRLANNSSIKNLAVKITGGASTRPTAFNVYNVKATLDGVYASATGTGAGHVDGVCLNGSSANLEILNSTIEATSTSGGQANGVYSDTGNEKLTINRSRILATNNNLSTGVSGDVLNFESLGASGVVRDSTIEAAGTNGCYLINNGGGTTFNAINTKITGIGGCNCGINPGENLNIANSQIAISGGTQPCDASVHYFNNFDGNFNPIPNQ